MAMIFTLVSALKDDAEARMLAARAAAQAARDREAALIEEEENRKFYGERVTRDRFLAWREGFRLEMEELRRRKRREEGGEGPEAEGRKKGKEERLTTGRALWEGGMVGRDGEEEEEEEEEEEGEGVVPGGGEKVQDLSRLKLGE